MFIDGHGIEVGSRVETEICIVGGGAAGIAMACEFADAALDVCLVESGGLAFDWASQDLYKGENAGLPYFDLNVCQLRYFGGNTNAWGGWCRPLDDCDFERRPWIPDSGWPFSRSEIEPFYRRAHAVCQLPELDYAPDDWVRKLNHRRARILPVDPSRLETAIYQFSPPTRFGKVYRERIRRARNIRCLLHTNALRLQLTPAAEATKHLEVAARPGAPFFIAAKYFVLAAGGIENTRLLLLSNDVMPNGAGNGNDLVGRYFMEHPHTKRQLLPMSRRPPLGLYGLAFHHRQVAARFTLPWPLQEREALLNYSGNVYPVYRAHDTDAWMSLRKLVLRFSASRRTDPFLRFPPYGKKEIGGADLYRIIRRLDRATLAAFLQLLQPDRFILGYVLESKSEQAPNRESRVTLQHERDAFGQNRVRLDWRMLPIDRHTVCRAEEIIEAEFQRLGIGRLESLPRALLTSWPANLEGGWHQLGTTRMHEDARQGVVDADCRIHGLANTFIASGSVFPTSGSAPPTLTVVALALRLADHLKKLSSSAAWTATMFKPNAAAPPLVAARVTPGQG